MIHATVGQRETSLRSIGIEKLVEWTFGAEKAQLEPTREGRVAVPSHLGYGSSWHGITQLAVLGYRVDTSPIGATFLAAGRVHSDADAVAAVLAGLMATGAVEARSAHLVVDHGRAGTRPSWMPGATPRVIPRPDPLKPGDPDSGWTYNQHGRQGRTEVVRVYPDHDKRGKPRPFEGRMCPIAFEPTRGQIDSARRSYLAWWTVLHELRERLIEGKVMGSHTITREMPPAIPWGESVKTGTMDWRA
jgi:hypothetical protein